MSRNACSQSWLRVAADVAAPMHLFGRAARESDVQRAVP